MKQQIKAQESRLSIRRNKMQKKRMLILCSMCLLLMLLVTGFVGASGNPAPAPNPPKVIELKFTYPGSPMTPLYSQGFAKWFAKLEKETQGKLKITGYPGGALLPHPESYAGVVAGIADMGHFTTGIEIHRFPLHNLLALNSLSMHPDERGVLIQEKLWEKFPGMKAEFKDVKVLMHWFAMPYAMHTTRKKVQVPGDMVGLKILCSAGDVTFLKEVGAVPVQMPIYDFAMALERGLGDGVFTSFAIVKMLNLHEMCRYHVAMGLGCSGFWPIMNLDKWNSLPPDIQKIIDDLRPWATEHHWRLLLKVDEEALSLFKKRGHTVSVPSPEEVQSWRDCGLLQAEEYIKKHEAPGVPVRAVYEEALRLIAREYRK